MNKEISYTKDIEGALVIIENIKMISDFTGLIRKEELIENPDKDITQSAYNRSIRELCRLGVLIQKKVGYDINKSRIKHALEKLKSYNEGYLSLEEVMKRFSSNQFLIRNEINNLLPELSVQKIDNIILQLQERGFIYKYKGRKSRGKYVITSEGDSIYISNVISKISSLYNDIIICYSTALEYHNLSRYANSRIIYISGNTSSEINEIFDKKIKQVRLKNRDLGIENIKENQLKIKITDIERTLIDCVRHPKYAIGWENVLHAVERLDSINEERILEYLREFRLPTLVSKVGVILEYYSEKLRITSRFLSRLALYKSVSPFRLIRNTPGKLNKNWNIYIPDDFFEHGRYY